MKTAHPGFIGRMSRLIAGMPLLGRRPGRPAATATATDAGMTIKLEDINNSPYGERFVGSRTRLATCTGVALLDHRRLVASSLVGQRMYLISFDLTRGKCKVDCSIPTTFRGQPICTDLIDYDMNDLLITSNCEHRSVSLYRLTGASIEHYKDVEIPDKDVTFCHGAAFVPMHRGVICATTNARSRYAYFLSDDGDIIHKIGDGAWRVKDVCFVDSGQMIVLYAGGTISKEARASYDSKISLVAFDLHARRHEVLHEQRFVGHTDCCRHLNGRIYVSNGTRDVLNVFRIEDDQLVEDGEVDGFDIPHGLDVLPSPDLLAVTNYGSNTITLRPLHSA